MMPLNSQFDALPIEMRMLPDYDCFSCGTEACFVNCLSCQYKEDGRFPKEDICQPMAYFGEVWPYNALYWLAGHQIYILHQLLLYQSDRSCFFTGERQ